MIKIILGLFIGFFIGSWSMFISKGTCEGEATPLISILFISLLVIPAILGYLIGKDD